MEPSLIDTISPHSPTDGFLLFKTTQEKKNMFLLTASWLPSIWFNNLITS